MMQDGVVVEIAPGADIAAPIEIVYATCVRRRRPRASSARSSWSARAPRFAIAESSIGRGGRSGQTFGCLIFKVGDNAEVGHTCAS